MEVATITCHHVYNYGASLQAYALQNYIENLGHSVIVIDYRLPEHRRYEMRILFEPPLPTSKAHRYIKEYPILRIVYPIYVFVQMMYTWGRKIQFDKFDKKFLKITSIRYNGIDALRKNAPKCDIYIAGSDQIWNTNMSNGTDPGYYLDFGNEKTKRVSYAASFGVSEIEQSKKAIVKRLLDKFDYISVREATGVTIINDLGLQCVQVVDPVFLLSEEEWVANLAISEHSPINDPYIFLYDFAHNDIRMEKLVKDLAYEKKLKIVSINDTRKVPYADIQINNAGPREFVEYIKYASYVISNSFHATAFSIIFKKEFATYPLLSQNNASRMVDLLSSLHIVDHFCPTSISIFEKKIEWQTLKGTLKKQINTSKEYLNRVLQN